MCMINKYIIYLRWAIRNKQIKIEISIDNTTYCKHFDVPFLNCFRDLFVIEVNVETTHLKDDERGNLRMWWRINKLCVYLCVRVRNMERIMWQRGWMREEKREWCRERRRDAYHYGREWLLRAITSLWIARVDQGQILQQHVPNLQVVDVLHYQSLRIVPL